MQNTRLAAGQLRRIALVLGLAAVLAAVCAADAPGVSAPNPTGMRGEELCQIAAFAGAHPRTRVLEFSEVNPPYDIDLRTCRLAAVAPESAANWA